MYQYVTYSIFYTLQDNDSHSSKFEKPNELSDAVNRIPPSSSTESAPSVTVVLRPKTSSSPEDTSMLITFE